MKKIPAVFFILFLIVSLFSLSLNPLIIFFARRQLKSVFKESEVFLQGCRFNPLRGISLLGIEIKNDRRYCLEAKEAGIEYSLFSLLRGEVRNLYLRDARLFFSFPEKNLPQIVESFIPSAGKSVFRINSLELSGLKLDLTAKDLTGEVILSSRMDLSGNSLDYLYIKTALLKTPELELKGVFLKIADNQPGGRLEITRIKYGKLNIAGVKCIARLSRNELFLDNLSADFLDGKVEGDLNFKLDSPPVYSSRLVLLNLDIAEFIDDFNFKDRFEMDGRLNGKLRVEGKGIGISLLGGDFSSIEKGGVLSIKDKRFLENMARGTNQSLNLLVESFKNYHYNTGIMRVSLDEEDIVLQAVLEGEAGRRNLEIRLHDFNRIIRSGSN